jgi:hypothetical protein
MCGEDAMKEGLWRCKSCGYPMSTKSYELNGGFVWSVGLSDFGVALSISMFVLAIFIAGFWIGVRWQEEKDAKKTRTK